jgi:hypothetical protein
MIKLADPTTFQPFVIVTGSGQRFVVPHPDYIDIPPLPEEEESQAPSYVTVYSRGKSVNRTFYRSCEHSGDRISAGTAGVTRH